MNSIAFELTDSNDEKHSLNSTDEFPKLVLNNDLISKMCDQLGIKKLKHLSLKLGVNNIALIIKEYTLTDTVYISDFYDIKSNISIFQTIGTNIHIVGQTIEHLQADCKSILLADSTINKLEIGMFEQHKRLGNCEFTDIFRADNLDLRNVTIRTLNIYAECKNINVQGCNIDEFNNNGNLFKEYSSIVMRFHLWQNTNVRKLSLSNRIEKLNFEDSIISRLIARSSVCIETVEIKDSIVENCYGFESKCFNNLTYDSWQWIGKSATNARNLQVRAESNYQMAKSLFKMEKKCDKFASKLFDFCAGYGYKPLRIIRVSGLIALLNTFIFTMVKVVNILKTQYYIPINRETFCKGISKVWENFLLSIAAFAGQTNFSMADGLLFWLSIIEYLLGVVLFAMFVNALYVRYKE